MVNVKKLTAKDMAFCGLFAALIGVGAFIKISIPVEPFPMGFGCGSCHDGSGRRDTRAVQQSGDKA